MKSFVLALALSAAGGAGTAAAQSECSGIQVEGRTVVAENTFEVDFAPFGKACFVTLGAEETIRDPELHVYKGGRSVFRFANPFEEEGGGCVVRAVAFDDLNLDGRRDVTVVGACQAAGANFFPANTIYLNTGEGFEPDEFASSQVNELETMRAVRAFVQKNRRKLFPRK